MRMRRFGFVTLTARPTSARSSDQSTSTSPMICSPAPRLKTAIFSGAIPFCRSSSLSWLIAICELLIGSVIECLYLRREVSRETRWEMNFELELPFVEGALQVLAHSLEGWNLEVFKD